MEFAEIVLTRAELKALRVLSKSNVSVEAHNREVLYRLVHFEFAEIHDCSGHKIVLYIISATAGSAFTLLVEHFGDILRVLQSLFQGG